MSEPYEIGQVFPNTRFLPHPELIPACPTCGDRDHTQLTVYGLTIAMPTEEEADRINLAGCMIQEPRPDPWWCPACERGFPWDYPFERTLLIKEPWASLVIDGHKTWELRRTSTKVRGSVALTPSGSGEIAGRADLVDVHGPFTTDELREHRHRHLVDDEFLDAYAAGKKLHAWEFRNARRFDWPIWYDHPQGAVIWVKLPT